MKLNRYNYKGFTFDNKIVAIGKDISNNKYFIKFLYPFVSDCGKIIYKETIKPKFRNLYALSALFFLPYLLMSLVGVAWMALYTLYTVLGGANVINGIKESKELGGFVNLVSIFCLTAFYLIGIISLTLWLLK
jgi:hypothetical protein